MDPAKSDFENEIAKLAPVSKITGKLLSMEYRRSTRGIEAAISPGELIPIALYPCASMVTSYEV